MKTRFLIIIGIVLSGILVLPAHAQYLGDKIPSGTTINGETREYAFPPSYVEFYYSNPAFAKFHVIADSYHYDVPYMITNGTISKMKMDCSNVELALDIIPSGNQGWLTLALPRQLIDSKMGSHKDDGFIVLENSNEVHNSDISSEKLRILIMPISNDTSHINIIGVNYPEHMGKNSCNGKNEYPFSYLLFPLKQFKLGIPIEKIQCNEGLMLVEKTDNSPACIKSSSLSKLNFRNGFNCVWNCSVPIPGDLIQNSENNKFNSSEQKPDNTPTEKYTIKYNESSYLNKVDLSGNETPRNSDGTINYDQFLYGIAKDKYMKIFKENNIPINVNDIFLMTGPSILMYTETGYACGYTNYNNQTFWLESRLNKDAMTELKIYNENPDQCRPSFDSCFCMAQHDLAEKTTKQLSYFDENQENQAGKILRDYLNEGYKIANVSNFFVIGRYDYDLGADIESFCGQFKGKPHEWYFHGHIKNGKILEFALDLDEKQKLCAISDNPQIFEFNKSAIVRQFGN